MSFAVGQHGMGSVESMLDRLQSDPYREFDEVMDRIAAIPPESLTDEEFVTLLVELDRSRWRLQAGYTVRKLEAMRRGLVI
jgi:hypothetical protein